jgi:hypothetical protein
MINSCQKGKAIERELARLLRDHLNIEVTRNWQQQAAIGGHDLSGVPDYAIECKGAKSYDNAWWEQTQRQAVFAGLKPALIYRITGTGRGKPDIEKWQCEVLASDVIPELQHEHYRVTMPLGAWIALVRERI